MPTWLIALFWPIPALMVWKGWLWFSGAVLVLFLGAANIYMATNPRGELENFERYVGVLAMLIMYFALAYFYWRTPAPTKIRP